MPKQNWNKAKYKPVRYDADALKRFELGRQATQLLKTTKTKPKPQQNFAHVGSNRLACLICGHDTDRIIITTGKKTNGCLHVIALCCQRHAEEAGYGWAGR